MSEVPKKRGMLGRMADSQRSYNERQTDARLGAPQSQRYEYTTEVVRSKLVGDRMDDGAVNQVLAEYAGRGWRLRSVTETEVKGRVGPGGTMGLLLIFERPVEG